jgi:hypothetical protein
MSDKPDILEIIHNRIATLEEIKAFILCPKTGLFFTENYLRDPYAAYLVLKHLLEVVFEEPDPNCWHSMNVPSPPRFHVVKRRVFFRKNNKNPRSDI